MLEISDERFTELISEVMDELPREHMDALKNIAIVYAEEPTAEQRSRLKLHEGETLFGLYEGVPLARRQGRDPLIPDKITIFRGPLVRSVANEAELRAEVKHTVWHEIAHYFGLDHRAIRRLENKRPGYS